jgi:hypothetical protein
MVMTASSAESISICARAWLSFAESSRRLSSSSVCDELRLQRQILGIPLLAPKQQQRQDHQSRGHDRKQDVAVQGRCPARDNSFRRCMPCCGSQGFSVSCRLSILVRHRGKPVFRDPPRSRR